MTFMDFSNINDSIFFCMWLLEAEDFCIDAVPEVLLDRTTKSDGK